MKQFDKLLKLLTDRMPRKVAFASLVLGGTLIAFVFLFIFLGGAHDSVLETNANLKRDLTNTTKNASTARDNRQFILDNKDKYEELLKGDRLVPHTRRVAMTQMSTIALQRGLSALSSNFTIAGNPVTGQAANAPVTGGYKLQVEKVDLKVGAALDSQVFEFMLDLTDTSFPGSAIIEDFKLERAASLTTEGLNQVSQGKADLVRGEVTFTWRTAQAQDQDPNAPAGGKAAK